MLTRALARHAAGSRFDALPGEVQREAVRAFVNWAGVAIGGSREPAVNLAAAVVADAGGSAQASLIGQGFKSDIASAAFVNCIASSVLAFDDAHLSSVAHPSSPAAAALLAIAQARPVSGKEFLNALALGIEMQCRIANMLVLPPSPFHPDIYVNGFSGPIGVALAAGRLLGLDEQTLAMAIGIAASQASGFRATHGTMTAHFRPGHATRVGVVATLLAAKGFDCTQDALEARGGFVDVYAGGADPDRALAGLGQHHEMLANRYKPYPCGIVIHPTIDACLEVRARMQPGDLPERIRLRVNPLALTLTGKRAPRTALESHVSVFHWAAVALVHGKATLAATRPECLGDEAIAALRNRIEAEGDPALGKGEARAEVRLASGAALDAHVVHARGSLQRPMTDQELRDKFGELTGPGMSRAAAAQLEAACWNLEAATDVGAELGALLP